jgi:DNA topoisomerase-3
LTTLIVAEKPSVARDLGRVLGATQRGPGCLEGNGLRITWCIGHMVELVQPAEYTPDWKRWQFETLPMIPDTFKLNVRKGVKDHWKDLKRALSDKTITKVVNACDAGREGELIFRYVYEATNCKAPIERLWISSMTDKAIQTGWANLKDGAAYEPLADAARCRSEADWIVGLNATRAMTCLARKAGGEQLLSVGRVQTPTLAMIVKRDQAIGEFEAQDFWTVDATFGLQTDHEANPITWSARWFRRQSGLQNPDRLADLATATAIADAVRDQAGTISTLNQRDKAEAPPLLYDLTSLQQRANQRYGLAAKETLDIAQALYERHKLLTYPRTDARHLTPDQVEGLHDVLRGIATVPPYAPFVEEIQAQELRISKRIVNAEEVGDHHAILPTGRSPMQANLNPNEKRVFDLVARRLLAALSPEAIFALTDCVVEVPPIATEGDGRLPEDIPTPLTFRSKGRICKQIGWQAVDPPGKKRKDKELPLLTQGDATITQESSTKKGQTQPPKHHNDATILRAMETAGANLEDADLKRAMRSAGLGTPATRAAILQTLIDRRFIRRQGKDLCATDRGTALIAAVPVDELKSAQLTGRWEARLSQIAEGKESRAEFMAAVGESIGQIIAAIEQAEPPPPERRPIPDGPELGKCPVCGDPVREDNRVYTCEKGRACSFVIFKSLAKRNVSKRMVKTLLAGEQTDTLKGFKSKKGKDFSAALRLDEEGKVKFVFEDRTPSPPREAAPIVNSSSPVGESCPDCKDGRIIAGRTAFGCDRWREGCGYRRAF